MDTIRLFVANTETTLEVQYFQRCYDSISNVPMLNRTRASAESRIVCLYGDLGCIKMLGLPEMGFGLNF